MSEAKATAMVSGFGAGKTIAVASRCITTKLQYPTINLLYCAPTFPLIRDIFYPTVIDLLTEQGFKEITDFHIDRSANEIHLHGGGKILCRTMEHPERLVGFQVGDAYLDEIDILPTDKAIEVWRKTLARIRKKFPDGKSNRIYVTTTPEGFKATYQLFKKDPIPGSLLIQASTTSNPHNPDDYVQTLKDSYPDQYIDAYIEGQFVNLTSGLVYYSFDRDVCHAHYVAKPRETLHIGMDFNIYKMAAIVWIMRKGKLYAVDELIDLRDTDDMCVAIKEKFPDHPILVYPDASGKSGSTKASTVTDHMIIKGYKFRVKVKNTNPFIRDRVMAMNAGFDKGYIFVNTEACPIFTECLEQQIYDNSGKPTKDGIIDNSVDAGGYAVYYLKPIIRQQVYERKLGGL